MLPLQTHAPRNDERALQLVYGNAYEERRAATLKEQERYEAIFRILLDAGVDVNARETGSPPLFMAVQAKAEALVRLLREAGAKE